MRCRLLSALLTVTSLLGAPPAAGEDLVVPLRLLRTGDIGALPLAEVSIGGERSWWLVDTGASRNLVSPRLAAKLEMRQAGWSRITALGGTQWARDLRLPELALGGRVWRDVTAVEVDVRGYFAASGAEVDGILGVPFIAGNAVTFDFPGSQMRLRRSAAAAGNEAQRVLPLQIVDGLPQVALSIGDRPAEPFLVDTGNPGALVVFEHRARQLRRERGALPTVKVRELGGEVTASYVLLEQVAIDGLRVRDVPAALESGARAHRGGAFDAFSGSLGVALFEDSRLTIDLDARRLIVERDAEPRRPAGGFGLMLASLDGQCRVVAVIDGGPAAQQGIAPGDRVTAIDGVANDGNAAATWQMLHGRAAADFSVDRDGAARVVRIERRRFFPALR